MEFINKLIRNSDPFRELQQSVDFQVHEALYEHSVTLIDNYAAKVEKLIDLTERVHNTILSVKHNQDSH